MKKIVGLATIPERKMGLHDTLNRLSPQVDHIHVWLNGYDDIPTTSLPNVTFHTGDDVGAVGKIKVLDFITDDDFYFFMVDDDIIYPPDYVEHTIKYYKKGSVISSHGKVYSTLPINSFNHGDVSGYYFASEITEMKKIHVVGTGVCMIDSTTVRKIPYDKFLSQPNMLDVWISSYCFLHDIPLYILPHKKNWLQPNPIINQTNSIWETSKYKKDKYLTSVFNHYITLRLKK